MFVTLKGLDLVLLVPNSFCNWEKAWFAQHRLCILIREADGMANFVCELKFFYQFYISVLQDVFVPLKHTGKCMNTFKLESVGESTRMFFLEIFKSK